MSEPARRRKGTAAQVTPASSALVVPPPHQGPRVPYEELVERARASLPSSLPRDAKQIMLALDVDGTLLLPTGASPRIRRTVREALEAGVNLVIATGRGLAATRPVFAELGLPDGFSVSSNGAQTVRWSRGEGSYHPQVLAEHRFDPSTSGQIMLDAIPELLLGVDDGQEGMLVTGMFPEGEMLSPQTVHPVHRVFSQPTPRMVARAPWMARDEFEQVLRGLPLDDVAVAVGWTAWADICGSGISKAVGLQDLADQLGIEREGTVAMGDGTNDIEMLRWAGHGVAMGGASAEVVAAANATTGPVDHDGSAAVIEALLERL